MQRVRLLGELGDRFGAEHEFYNLRTPADAIKLLCINNEEFQTFLIESHEKGIGYRLLQADIDLDYSDLHLPLGHKDLVLVPVIAGSGKGLTQVLIGIGLIAASFLIPGAAAIGTFGLTKAIAVKGLVAGIGATLALGGAAQLLSPQPQVPTLSGNRFGSGTNASTRGPQSETRGADGQQSYAYTGAANTVGMGAVVPVAYGKVLVGSQLLSANVEVTDESDPLSTAIKTPSFDTIRIGGEPVGYGYSDVSGIQTRRTDQDSFGGADQYNLYYNIGLSNGAQSTYFFDTRDGKRDRFGVCLGIPAGIRDRVSGAGSSLVDGFITYRVDVLRGRSQDLLGSIQATIQGLAFGHYRWVHRFVHADNPSDNGTIRVEIIDFRCEGDVYLQLQGFGYDL
jgi:predicted phage tail protein